MNKDVFYSKGLRFSCKKCSACCRHDSGFVFLSQEDLEKLSEKLKMNIEDIKSKYCRWVDDRLGGTSLSLKEKPNNDCIFWDSECTVYEARPVQCVTFPFWDTILFSENVWETASFSCPGINNGALHDRKTIENFLKMRDNSKTLVT